jgi:hypothetical protein
MPKDNQILVRVNDPMKEAVEEFAEDRDYNKAEASRKILESRLKGEGYLRRHYGDNDLEPMPDGGQIIEKLENIENDLSEVEREEEPGLSIAESPINTNPILVITLVLVFFITLKVFGFI